MNTLAEYSTLIVPPHTAIHPLSFSALISSEPEPSANGQFRTTILANPERLQEIFDLRLTAWEGSVRNEIANKSLFPDGWKDMLDESAIHWVTLDERDAIVAAARLNIFHSPKAFPYHIATAHLPLPLELPFAFFSRLVVHPQCRKNGLGRALYEERSKFCLENNIPWSLVFINDPHVITMFEKEGFQNPGKALVSYHPSATPHSVNVFAKEYNCERLRGWNQVHATCLLPIAGNEVLQFQ